MSSNFHTYMPHAEFQSHESGFDYLKSLEIEERINQIQWCKTTGNALFLLSTNDKTVKLWKVYNKTIRRFDEDDGNGRSDPAMDSMDGDDEDNNNNNNKNNSGGYSGGRYVGGGKRASCRNDLYFPSPTSSSTTIVANPRRIYSNAHNYHINSISNNSDGETFLSADDLRVNIWNLEGSEECFNIIDVKPPQMEDLTEVITSAMFHPTHCHILMHSSSKGTIKIGDMRDRALVDNHALVLSSKSSPSQGLPGSLSGDKSFFSEIVASVSDAKFSPDGRFIVSRDYMTVKLWDANMTRHPVRSIPLQEHLMPSLVDLYENDCIFDKFECCTSGDGSLVASGSYDGRFKVFDSATGDLVEDVKLDDRMELDKEMSKGDGMDMRDGFGSPGGGETGTGTGTGTGWSSGGDERMEGSGNSSYGDSEMDVYGYAQDSGGCGGMNPETGNHKPPSGLNDKLLHMTWEKHNDVLAVCGSNRLYLYCSTRGGGGGGGGGLARGVVDYQGREDGHGR